jgi:uncharacterized protein YwqG
MPKKFNLEFIPAAHPIRDAVTKFGGQPVWLSRPEWPVSKGTGEPMTFIGQIKIPELFGIAADGMAYVFMTDDSRVDGTWEADGGENSIVIQRGKVTIARAEEANGPAIYKMVPSVFGKKLEPKPCEFSVSLVEGQDPEFINWTGLSLLPPGEADKYLQSLGGNKVGGVPGFLQVEEFPSGGPWKLLFQMDSTKLPFFINFGDCGVGYGFISEDGTQGKFLWQCG